MAAAATTAKRKVMCSLAEQQQSWRKRSLWCHRAALALGIMIVTPFLWMTFDRRPCVEISPIKMTPSEARPGETTIISWTAKPLLECDGVVIGRTMDAAHVWHEGNRGPTVYKDVLEMNGQVQTFSKPYVVPNGAPGKAVYEPAVFRSRNFVQRWIFRPGAEHPFRVEYTILPQKTAPAPRAAAGQRAK